MTIEEFNSTPWKPGMFATYEGRSHAIASVDFGEQLIGLLGVVQNEPELISWVRCENATLEHGRGK